MAAADAATPSPERIFVAALAFLRLVVSSAEALIYLALASTWVGYAGCAAVLAGFAAGRDAWYDGGELVVSGSLKVTVFAIALLFALLVVFLLVVCAWSKWVSSKSALPPRKRILFSGDGLSKREFSWESLREPGVLGCLVAAIFALLMSAGYVVMKYLKGSEGERIGTVIAFVGAFGAIAMLCFVIIPAVSLKVWRGMRTMKQQIEDLQAAAPLRQC